MFRTLRRKLFRTVVVSGIGAAASYFLDRDRGQERREQIKAKADTLLKRSTPSAGWQPERAANVFDAPSVSTPPTATPADPAAAPAMTDVIATPDREIDPLASRP